LFVILIASFMRQTAFGFLSDFKREFGGSLLEGKRKTKRPLSTKEPIHLVLKSTGNRVFSPGDRRIENLIRNQAAKCKIKVFRVSLNWTHVHAIIQIKDRKSYNSFIRTVTALLVSLISKIKKIDLTGLFDLRPFTKIISWGRQFRNVFEYHDLNDLEAFGYVKREKKKAKQRKRK